MKYLNKISLLFAFIFIGFSCDLTDLDQLDNPNAVTDLGVKTHPSDGF